MLQEGRDENKLEYIQLSHRPRSNGNGEMPVNRGDGHKNGVRHSKAAERLRKQKRNRIIGIVVLSVILVALIGFIVFKLMKNDSTGVSGTAASSMGSEAGNNRGEPLSKLSENDFQFTTPADRQEVGTPEIKKEIADYEGYVLRYPVMGNEAMDASIVQRADDIISVFKTEVQGCRSENLVRMTMLADYEAYQTGEALVSVKFDIHKELPLDVLSGDSMETYTYDMSDGTEVTLGDVLKEGYLDMLVEKARAFAEGRSAVLKETVTADTSNFKYYTWNEDGLTLYFSGGILLEGIDEPLSFTIPMEELEEYLTKDLSGAVQEAQAPVSTGNVDPTKPMVCLTFDDGPKSSTTPELLDILEENDARATFFVVGSALKKEGAQDIIKRELELGCQVGNHTMDHKNFKKISDEEINQQIEGVNDILEGWGLPRCSTVRPPYGGWNNHVLEVVKYPMARWDVDTLDWDTRDVQSTINNVLYDEKLKAEDGDIILMHDIHAETIEACKTIIPELKARGFQLVTMEEMFAAKGISYEAGKVYYSDSCIKTDFGS